MPASRTAASTSINSSSISNCSENHQTQQSAKRSTSRGTHERIDPHHAAVLIVASELVLPPLVECRVRQPNHLVNRTVISDNTINSIASLHCTPSDEKNP